MYMAPFGIHRSQSKGYPFKEQNHKETLAERTVANGLAIIARLRKIRMYTLKFQKYTP